MIEDQRQSFEQYLQTCSVELDASRVLTVSTYWRETDSFDVRVLVIVTHLADWLTAALVVAQEAQHSLWQKPSVFGYTLAHAWTAAATCISIMAAAVRSWEFRMSKISIPYRSAISVTCFVSKYRKKTGVFEQIATK